ncbi:MAG: hypothetical protein ACRC0S_06410 [Fusobacteriaceae bacterium]
MKRYTAILLGLMIAAIGYYFYTKEKEYLTTEVYILEGKLYSLFTDKKISGVILNKSYNRVHYKKYKNGIIKSEKIVNENMDLIKKNSFNNLGLLEGKFYDKSKYNSNNGMEQYLSYKNNILQGKSIIADKTFYFIDGTINGTNYLDKHSRFGNKISYKEGIPDFIELDIFNSEYPKELLFNESVPEKFNGGILETLKHEAKDVLKLSQYKDGNLVRRRIYNNGNDRLELIGLKIEDTFYHENGKIRKIYTYDKDGTLMSLNSYDINEIKDGLFIEDRTFDVIKVLNYSNGILNGMYEEYFVTEDNKIEKLSGFYKLGIFSGQSLNYGKIENYLNGIKVDEIDLDKIIKEEKIVIEELKKIPENFTGFTRDASSIISEYAEGKIFKQYFIKGQNKSLTEVKEMKDNGGYIYRTYNYGILMSQREFDEFNIENGKYIHYYSQGRDRHSKVISNVTNGKVLGESICYNANEEVMYIDIYHSNDTVTRTYYTNYENNEIEKIVTGRKINGVWTGDVIQETPKE